ncbi:MAG: FtsQ-type POTRA domain-containing protein [Erysipelotrichaceae bacterium]|nr:FtsQ-type POTRA domain-containing protein [Bacillota bacterium]NLP21984.1 FtsQ-type POTRA domain-containing protein [Erysipelotrichaceae bacterium]HCY07026.1 hypothetical protein [Erysipelotrichaceae bacterium]
MVDSNDKIFDDLKPQNEGVNEVFKRHKKRVNKESFEKHKNLIYKLSIITGLLLIFGFYFFSSESNIKSIVIEGNDFLTNDAVKEISGLSLDSKYYLNPLFLVENKLKKHEMIKSAKVTYEQNNIIKIAIEENKPVGYRYLENPEILLDNGKIIPLISEYMGFIARIPLINGFVGEEQEYLLIKALSKVDSGIIENIAEISQYEFKFDPYTLEVYMRDGNYFFASYYGLEFINAYNSIASNLTEKGVCLFADDNLKVATKKKCPWDEVTVELEYWKDENGEYILNKYGDRVVVHYLEDEYGNLVLDEEGNKIPIPVDAFGEEIEIEIIEEEDIEQDNIE